jgi:hypothetical protein
MGKKLIFLICLLLALFSINQVSSAITVQGYVHHANGTQVLSGTRVVIQNINQSTRTDIATSGPPGQTGFYGNVFVAANGETVRVTGFNSSAYGANSGLSDGSSTLNLNITLAQSIINVTLPLSNSFVYNNLSDILNVSVCNVTTYNYTIRWTISNGLQNNTICSGEICFGNYTTYSYRTSGIFNLTIYALNKTNSSVQTTINNIFIGNNSQSYANSTYDGKNIWCYLGGHPCGTASGDTDHWYLYTGIYFSGDNASAYFYSNISKVIPKNVTIYNATFTASRYSNESGNGTGISISNVSFNWAESSYYTPPASVGAIFDSLNMTSSIPNPTWKNLTYLISSWIADESSNWGIGLFYSFGESRQALIARQDSNSSRHAFFNITYYLSNTAPVITINYPQNNSVNFTTNNVTANITVTDVNFDQNIRVETWLNASYSLLENTNICNCSYNVSFLNDGGTIYFNFTNMSDGTHYWVTKADDGKTNGTTQINKLIVSLNGPLVNLNSPLDYYSSSRDVSFNATTTDPNGLANFTLYTNFSGTFDANQTNQSDVTSGDSFIWSVVNIPEGAYVWNALATNTLNRSSFSLSNSTIIIDITFPKPNITSIITTTGSQVIYFNVTATDTYLNSCKYSIFNSTGGIDGLYNNVSISCNINSTTAVISAFSTYNLTFYAKDLAGNENSTTSSFTVSESAGGGSGGGGVENQTEIIIVASNRTFCGDTICQDTAPGNDAGVVEDFYNCPQDCKGFNLDSTIFYCFDNDPATGCIWDQIAAKYIGLFMGLLIVLLSFTTVEEPKTKKQILLFKYFSNKFKKKNMAASYRVG